MNENSSGKACAQVNDVILVINYMDSIIRTIGSFATR
jgi:hypothetical protein